jgi:Z1 domain
MSRVLNGELVTRGVFYKGLKEDNHYSIETQRCIEETVTKLMINRTSNNNPGMLLGKIQSGKTRTFIGVTALAFDNGYDMAIVLTKGTKALAKQTLERLKKDFKLFIEDDLTQLHDIMNLPDNLTQFELEQKVILVVKKETNNLVRLAKALFETYPLLKEKKVLIIDDEADFASIGFSKTKNEIFEIRKIAGQIDELRQNLDFCDFLQVTATPYSLYLQPTNSITLSGFTFEPVKPAFTSLVPVPEEYIGGEYYFQESQDNLSIAFHLYEEIDPNELEVLKAPDRRRFKIENALDSTKILSLRAAFMNFLVGGNIRRLQDQKNGIRSKKFSFIIHTEQKRLSHQWQEEVVFELNNQLISVMDSDSNFFDRIVENAYEKLKVPLQLLRCDIPSLFDVNAQVRETLQKGQIMITKVNSEKDVNELLDDTGQLKLRVPLNVFIGGQILDRGITIANLIGFYYGRNPNKFQQDTVLQHSRMFGYRPLEDLAVTKFYTTPSIYNVMNRIHEFDTSLRKAVKQGDNRVVFIQKDTSDTIIPCNPNKILLSRVTALKPFKRLLPIGFQTVPKKKLEPLVKNIDREVEMLNLTEVPSLINYFDVKKIIEMIHCSYDTDKGESWDLETFLASMEYLSYNIANSNKGKVWCMVRKDRNIGRIRQQSGRFEDAPDTPTGANSELTIAKKTAINHPVLILIKQNGEEQKGWKGSPFWWPVLVAPRNTPPVIYAGETIDK